MLRVVTLGVLVCAIVLVASLIFGGGSGHQYKLKFQNAGLITIVLISWGIALFEYFFQVPANRIGYEGNGGPFSLVELKVIQEVITLLIFSGFMLLAFKSEVLKWNHLVGFVFLVLAVFFVFKK